MMEEFFKELPSAFVSTPLTCSRGWTRGMPPPTTTSKLLFSTYKNHIETRLGLPASTRQRFVTGTFSKTFFRSQVSSNTSLKASAVPVEENALSKDARTPSFTESEDATVREYVSALANNGDPHVPQIHNDSQVLDSVFGKNSGNSRRELFLQESGSTTKAVHGGEQKRQGKKARAILDAIAMPIVQSSTFTFRSSSDCIAYNQGQYDSFEYGRYGNPTTRAAEEKIMMLEEAEDALVSASGMNSVTTMLLALLSPNDCLVTTRDCYRRTRQFLQTVLPRMNIQTIVVDPADTASVEAALKRGARLFFSEMPTNPLIRVIDAKSIIELCHKYGTVCCIDSTFATAYNFKPLCMGADLVLHSGTKYLGGHNDLMCGVLAGKKDLLERIRSLHGILGGVVDPHSSYLLLRGMKTLPLRMRAHNENAAALAQELSQHPKIAKVHYPSLSNHPDYSVAKAHFKNGFGGVLSFEICGDPFGMDTFAAGIRFVDALSIPHIGPSLGGVESLVEQVCIMGYFDQPQKVRRELGITNGLIRFSCGVEDKTDLLNDVLQALEAV
ncbi:cystathionine gamma-synthase [Galdieria sulphuraria]|uniref:Cystathionine gamma-synthase n=1 Tax=Galdieria sulphuraria TaxID=130081 RepID=M2X9G9_GALSU|nr:cystathionine gamma-synthase [Galdieria sulphuraria]EME26477.1 cystathionine gamma-synthase [Galdieria sulphuraria]|eukprot:XP_005702997.1 cystathionine gamma-synthase [Galdieria sulphuraria]